VEHVTANNYALAA